MPPPPILSTISADAAVHLVARPNITGPRHGRSISRRQLGLRGANRPCDGAALAQLGSQLPGAGSQARRGPLNRRTADATWEGHDETSEQQIRVLVADYDVALRDMIISYLRQHGMHAVSISGRPEMIREVSEREPSLIILDLQLGKYDGLDLLRDLRLRSDVPVITITADRHHEMDRVIGLELGADDYLSKPFNLRELLARIRAVLRRCDNWRSAPASKHAQNRARFAGWQFNRRTRRLTNDVGETMALTKGEYGLLIAFLEAPQRTLTREYLLQATRIHEDVFDRSIDVQVLRLRRRLEADPSAPLLIQTERGVGYAFMTPVEWF
jgi:two-component system OmpR family response regulator